MTIISSKLLRTLFIGGGVLAMLFLEICRQQSSTCTHPIPLTQRGYLWQRNWTSAVADAAFEADKRLDGVVILGGEIQWKGALPQIIRANIDWDSLRNIQKPCGIALRVAPYSGPFRDDDTPIRTIISSAQSLLSEAKSHGVAVEEFQIDFDCADKKLSGYRIWLQVLRRGIPTRLVITTLPSWLNESDFLPLIREVDGYILQVHSVTTLKESGRAVLCDTQLARKWVQKAANLGQPFSVALPTYRCLAGYDSEGKLLTKDTLPSKQGFFPLS